MASCQEINERLDAGTPSAYLQQTARAYRALERYRAARTFESGPSVDEMSYYSLEDALWTFFQNCWHIKDWLRHDRTVPEDATEVVLSSAEKDLLLKVVADLANGSKHLGRDGCFNRVYARDDAIQCRDNPDGSITVDHVISFDEGAERREMLAIEVAEQAMRCWESLFVHSGLRALYPPSTT